MWQFPWSYPFHFFSQRLEEIMKRTRKTDGGDKVLYICKVNQRVEQSVVFCHNKTDWNYLPPPQKDTKSLPLAHVNDKEAESSKGKQSALYTASLSERGKIITHHKPLICRYQGNWLNWSAMPHGKQFVLWPDVLKNLLQKRISVSYCFN